MVLLFAAVLVAVLSRLGAVLSPVRVEGIETNGARPDTDRYVPVHTVGEWEGGPGKEFRQAPLLDAAVAEGNLPPVEERLPADPLVIHSPESNGPYGGTWRRGALGPRCIDVVTDRRLMREGLLKWDARGETIVPNLAKRWETSDDGREFTFYLREGVRWSDGHPFSAADVLFWYEGVLNNRELTPTVPRAFRREGETVRVEAVDDYTVTFRFAGRYGLFPYLMASEGHEPVMYPAHYMSRFHPDHTSPEELQRNIRDGGFVNWRHAFTQAIEWRNLDMPRLWPWVLQEPFANQVATFVRNPFYWKVDPEGNQLPYIDRVQFQISNEELINMKAIQGEIGMQGRHIHFENLPLLMERSPTNDFSVRLWRSLESVNIVLVPNLRNEDPVLGPLLADKTFRRALSLAIDRDEIRETAYFGLGRPRQMAPLPESPFYSEDAAYRYVEYDPVKAGELLDSLGLDRRNRAGARLMSDGRPLSVRIETSARPTAALHLVIEHLRTVGIDAHLKVQSGPLFWEREGTRLTHIIVHGGIDWFIPVFEAGAFYIPYRQWYLTGGERGEEPAEELRKYMELSIALEGAIGSDEEEEIIRRLNELRAENVWTIGLVGELPSIHVVSNSFLNVPTDAAFGWRTRSIGNTAPECYAIVDEH